MGQKRRLPIIFACLFLLWALGCGGGGGNGDGTSLYEKDVRLAVPYVPNYGGTCASSSMTMMLQYLGTGVTFNDVYSRAGPPPYIDYNAVDQWIRQEFKLKLQLYKDRTINDILKSIDERYPVMVLQLYSKTWSDGHNRVVIGYNLELKQIIINDPSDLGPNYRLGFEEFEKLWRWEEVSPGWPPKFLWLIMPIDAPDPI